MARAKDVAKRGRSRSGGPATAWWLVGLAVALIVVVLAVQSDDGPAPDGAVRTCTPVSAFSDLHGLAVDPNQPGRLYAATHHGLMRTTNGSGWCRVGASQDDLMGFSLHPTNASTMWASGHPRSGGNMGVRQSTDGGYTWETLALEGVDFHAMAVSPADPARLWGHWDGRVHRSDDGGHTWNTVARSPEPLRSFVPDPLSGDVVHAVGAQRVHVSRDGGETWTTFLDQTLTALGVHPSEDVLFGAAGPRLSRSSDGGSTWQALSLDPDGGTIGFLVLDPATPDTLYAATYQTGIYRSTDAGDTWAQVKAPSR